MNNPFVFGKVVYGESFLNRESEISDITQSLQSGQNIICYSPRRYGKTSLLMRVKQNLEAKGHIVFFIDFFRVTSLEDLYNIYASSIANTIRSPIKALIQTLQNILPSINPKVVFKSSESPTVEVSLPLPVLLKTETLHELFGSLEEFCKQKKKKGTVIFDEFQELTIIKDGPQLSEKCDLLSSTIPMSLTPSWEANKIFSKEYSEIRIVPFTTLVGILSLMLSIHLIGQSLL